MWENIPKGSKDLAPMISKNANTIFGSGYYFADSHQGSTGLWFCHCFRDCGHNGASVYSTSEGYPSAELAEQALANELAERAARVEAGIEKSNRQLEKEMVKTYKEDIKRYHVELKQANPRMICHHQ